MERKVYFNAQPFDIYEMNQVWLKLPAQRLFKNVIKLCIPIGGTFQRSSIRIQYWWAWHLLWYTLNRVELLNKEIQSIRDYLRLNQRVNVRSWWYSSAKLHLFKGALQTLVRFLQQLKLYDRSQDPKMIIDEITKIFEKLASIDSYRSGHYDDGRKWICSWAFSSQLTDITKGIQAIFERVTLDLCCTDQITGQLSLKTQVGSEWTKRMAYEVGRLINWTSVKYHWMWYLSLRFSYLFAAWQLTQRHPFKMPSKSCHIWKSLCNRLPTFYSWSVYRQFIKLDIKYILQIISF